MNEDVTGIPNIIMEKAEVEAGYAIAAGLFAIARSLELIADELLVSEENGK